MDWFWKLFDWRTCRVHWEPGKFFVGYGPVNYWHKQNARTWTALHAKHGVPCVHIEAFGWASAGLYDKPDEVISALKSLAGWCKRRGLMLFVSVTNDNKGSGKYGDDRRGLEQFRPAITAVLKALKGLMWDGLYIQPVGETQTPAGRAIEAEAVGMFPASHLVRNTGSRPTSGGGWAQLFAFHPASMSTPVPRGAWCVSDHSQMLNELGGLYDQDFEDAKLEGYARKMRTQGTPFVHYGFAVKEACESDIEALGKAMK